MTETLLERLESLDYIEAIPAPISISEILFESLKLKEMK